MHLLVLDLRKEAVDVWDDWMRLQWVMPKILNRHMHANFLTLHGPIYDSIVDRIALILGAWELAVELTGLGDIGVLLQHPKIILI